MDVIEAIKSRRSVRRFTGELINDEQVKTLLEAGFEAPSAHNSKPAHFLVVKDEDIINKITAVHKYTQMLKTAKCAIIVCGDKIVQEQMGFLVADCSAATQNILLAARGLGLGTCWCGIYDVEQHINDIREIFNLPENIVPVSLIAVGNVDDLHSKERIRYNEERVHIDKW